MRGDHDRSDRTGCRLLCSEPKAIVLALLAREPQGLGVHLGSRVQCAIHRGLPGLRRLPRVLRSVDGERSGPVRRCLFRRDLLGYGRQHPGFRGARGQPQAVPGAAAVRRLHAAGLGDQGDVDAVRAALGSATAACLHLASLDAQRRVGPVEQRALDSGRDRGSVLVERAVDRAGLRDRRASVEMDAVLDRDPAGRPHVDPAGHL